MQTTSMIGKWLPRLSLLAPLACAADPPLTFDPEVEPLPVLQTAMAGAPLTAQVPSIVVVGLTVNAAGMPVIPALAPSSTLLYYARNNMPVLAPDGHHVTAGEFAAAHGTASVKCLGPGTHITLHLSGLIPNATYRVWLLKFRSPGFSIGPPPDFSNLIGEGSLGSSDRSRNTFQASAGGEGQITRIQPEGALSEALPSPPYANEPAGACLLSDEFEWHLVGALQQPGQPTGPHIGPPAIFVGTAVEQFVFLFRQM
jgi:hypothetical protein